MVPRIRVLRFSIRILPCFTVLSYFNTYYIILPVDRQTYDLATTLNRTGTPGTPGTRCRYQVQYCTGRPIPVGDISPCYRTVLVQYKRVLKVNNIIIPLTGTIHYFSSCRYEVLGKS
jgi:hypothetical protein